MRAVSRSVNRRRSLLLKLTDNCRGGYRGSGEIFTTELNAWSGDHDPYYAHPVRAEPFGSEPLGHELDAEWLKSYLLMGEGSTEEVGCMQRWIY